MSAHVSRCFMGTAEEIAAHHRLVADAKAIGADEERARVVAYLTKYAAALGEMVPECPNVGWMEAGVENAACLIERGEHEKSDSGLGP